MVNPYDDDDESWLDTRPDEPASPPSGGPELWVVHMNAKPLGAARGRADGFVCFGCFETGDLGRYVSLSEFREAVTRAYPGSPATGRNRWAEDMHRVLVLAKEGDLLVYPVEDSEDVFIGKFEGGYARLEKDAALIEEDSAHLRRVRWLATVSRSSFSSAAQRSFNSRFMIHSSAGYRSEVVALLAARGISE